MPFERALLTSGCSLSTIQNPLRGLRWALVVNRHVEAEKAVDGASPCVEYQRDITDKGVTNLIRRRQTSLELGFDDKPAGIISSPAKRCWKTAHGCAGVSFDHIDSNSAIPLEGWGWACGWPEGATGTRFYSLLNANKRKPARFFLDDPDFRLYVLAHARNAWFQTVESIRERGSGLYFASGHSPTQDVMCYEAVKDAPILADHVLNVWITYGQGWWIGSPDGDELRFGWMVQ